MQWNGIQYNTKTNKQGNAIERNTLLSVSLVTTYFDAMSAACKRSALTNTALFAGVRVSNPGTSGSFAYDPAQTCMCVYARQSKHIGNNNRITYELL